MKNIYTVTKGCYRDFAEQIARKMEGRGYVSGVFYSGTEGREHRLEVSLVVYRDVGSGCITDICDIWWDSCTLVTNENGDIVPMINDFDFARLRSELF